MKARSKVRLVLAVAALLAPALVFGGCKRKEGVERPAAPSAQPAAPAPAEPGKPRYLGPPVKVEEKPKVAPAPTATAAGGDCFDECVRRNQMRAVAKEQIDADCRQKCRERCVRECVEKSQMKAVSQERIEADCRRKCGP